CAERVRGLVVANTTLAYLHDQRAVVRILLHDAVAIARDPDVVLVIDEAAVNAVGQNISVAPRGDRVAFGVEFHHGWRGDAFYILRRDQIASGDNEDVVLRVDARSSDLAGNPRARTSGCGIGRRGKWLRPRAVCAVLRDL